MIEDKNYGSVERHVFEAGHLDPLKVDPEREPN
jgi:hypothetical protein